MFRYRTASLPIAQPPMANVVTLHRKTKSAFNQNTGPVLRKTRFEFLPNRLFNF